MRCTHKLFFFYLPQNTNVTSADYCAECRISLLIGFRVPYNLHHSNRILYFLQMNIAMVGRRTVLHEPRGNC
jgi:hypothetical protein